MRQDKLTTKLQEALADAQSLAVGNDNPYIEPVHLLTALLNQDDGGARSLLQRAGANVGGLSKALTSSLERLPKVSGTDGNVQISREFAALLNLAEIVPVLPGCTGSLVHEGVVQPQLTPMLEITRGWVPTFLNLNTWSTMSPCLMVPKSNLSSTNLIWGPSALAAGAVWAWAV